MIKQKDNHVPDIADKHDDHVEPPDGGSRAWIVMCSAFLCDSILFGIINTFGTIYLTLQEQLKQAGETNASGKAALVGSLAIGTTFLLSTLGGILADLIGYRTTTLIGGLIASSGMFLSAVFLNNYVALCLTYGVLFGLGAALAYSPSLGILGHYFKRYLGRANGFVAAGSSVSTALLPFFIDHMIRTYSLRWAFFALGMLTLTIVGCSLTYKPVRSSPDTPSSTNTVWRSLLNVEIWRRPRYIIWLVSVPVALVGYFVLFVHTPKLVVGKFPGFNENAPITCYGIASGVGRLVCGYLADQRGINRIYMQQCSFAAIGLLTMLIPFTQSYAQLMIVMTTMGLFDGCFISLLGPLANEICGPHGATQAIGFQLGACSVSLTIGPPLAGMLNDHTSSYTLPYVLAGVPPLIGASMLFMMKLVGEGELRDDMHSGTVEEQNQCKGKKV